MLPCYHMLSWQRGFHHVLQVQATSSSWGWSALLKVMLTVRFEGGDSVSPSFFLRSDLGACLGHLNWWLSSFKSILKTKLLRRLCRSLFQRRQWWIKFDWYDKGLPTASSSLSHRFLISTYDGLEETAGMVMKTINMLRWPPVLWESLSKFPSDCPYSHFVLWMSVQEWKRMCNLAAAILNCTSSDW